MADPVKVRVSPNTMILAAHAVRAVLEGEGKATRHAEVTCSPSATRQGQVTIVTLIVTVTEPDGVTCDG